MLVEEVCIESRSDDRTNLTLLRTRMGFCDFVYEFIYLPKNSMVFVFFFFFLCVRNFVSVSLNNIKMVTNSLSITNLLLISLLKRYYIRGKCHFFLNFKKFNKHCQ